MDNKKEYVILIYGGQSTEHDVSRRSAYTIYKNLDLTKYNRILIGIDESGMWWLQPDSSRVENPASSTLLILKDKRIDPGYLLQYQDNSVVFSIIHGHGGEDGLIQGLLECLNMAYVGSGCMGSAIGMDKLISKKLVEHAGIRVVPYSELNYYDWTHSDQSQILDSIVNHLKGFSMFIKPACQGSSVGISKVSSTKELKSGIDEAFKYDSKLLIEKAFRVREIECAVLGGDEPKSSVPGEIITEVGFYDYDAKYKTDTSIIKVPADLLQSDVKELKSMAVTIFKTLNLYGMSRVDFFFNKDDGLYYFNEVNTVPGFTSISQYPKLWDYEGIPIHKLIDQLIQLGKSRYLDSKRIKKSYNS